LHPNWILPDGRLRCPRATTQVFRKQFLSGLRIRCNLVSNVIQYSADQKNVEGRFEQYQDLRQVLHTQVIVNYPQSRENPFAGPGNSLVECRDGQYLESQGFVIDRAEKYSTGDEEPKPVSFGSAISDTIFLNPVAIQTSILWLSDIVSEQASWALSELAQSWEASSSASDLGSRALSCSHWCRILLIGSPGQFTSSSGDPRDSLQPASSTS